MTNAAFTDLVALTTPATGDILAIVDISDSTQSPSGSTKQITLDNLFVRGTVTTSAPIIAATQTWNAGGVTFTGVSIAITNTASAAASLPFQVLGGAAGATNLFSVRIDGLTTVTSGGLTVTAGSLGVYVAPDTNIAIKLTGTMTGTGATQSVVSARMTFASTTITGGTGVDVAIATAAAAFTLVSGYGVNIGSPTIGAASAITTLYGLHIANQTGGGTNYAIYTNTGTVRLGDLLLLGDTAVGNTALKINRADLTGTAQYGMDCTPTVTSAATATGAAINAKISTAAAAFTCSAAYGIYIAAPTIGAASAITTVYGLNIENQTGGGTNYAIKCNGGQVNLGLPTSSAGLTAGSLWSNSGVVTVA